MSKRKMNFDTKVIHAGQPHPRIEGAVNVPIFQSSTFEYKGQKNYDDLVYVRLNNTPSHKSVSRHERNYYHIATFFEFWRPHSCP